MRHRASASRWNNPNKHRLWLRTVITDRAKIDDRWFGAVARLLRRALTQEPFHRLVEGLTLLNLERDLE
jgi:hypothetical protein